MNLLRMRFPPLFARPPAYYPGARQVVKSPGLRSSSGRVGGCSSETAIRILSHPIPV